MVLGKRLHELLPQSDPMLMIDTLVSSDDLTTHTKLTINSDNIFCIKGKFREAGIIENMAQTAAVRSGYEASKKNEKIRTGYIGSIKNLKIFDLPKVSQTLNTSVTQKTEIGNIMVIHAQVKYKKRSIAECEMTIILLDDE